MHQPPRVCLITGAATGIGAACAREFAQQGWQLALSWLDDSTHVQILDVAAGCEARSAATLVHQLDVTSDASCVAFAQAALQRFGRIDALINCAGTVRVIAHTELEALEPAEFHRCYDVNTVGLYRMTRACAPALKASGRGSVVNLSSSGSASGRGASLADAASRGAINTLTLALARALAPHIRVNAIAPGFVAGSLPGRLLDAVRQTEVVQAQTEGSPLRRIAQPEEVAALAWFLTERAPGVTGAILPLDNGLHLQA